MLRRRPNPIACLLLAGLTWSSVALGAGTWRGVELASLAELGFKAPSYETADEGWTAQFPKGLARLYVAPSAEALEVWLADKQEFLARRQPQPYPAIGDEAWGDGNGLLLVREGNVGLLIETTAGAHGWAEVLLGALQPGDGSWPASPALRAMPSGVWVAQTPGSVHVSYMGGSLDPSAAPGSPLTFERPPRRLVAWDAMGRSSVAWFDEQGQPVEPPPPEVVAP